jgi:2-C-methyl-D-erythritol 4-phosphate cytidylyltransferase
LQRLQEMIVARIAAAPPSAVAAATAAAADGTAAMVDPAEDILDQTLNRVLIVKTHTPQGLLQWLNQLTTLVSNCKGM